MAPARTALRLGLPRAWLVLAGALSLVVLAALWVGAPPAGAFVSGRFGIQERTKVTVNHAEPLQYHGGPVLHSSDSYAIYWDPIGTYRGDWKRLINGYFHSVGAASGSLEDVFALNGQYADAEGRAANASTFRGGYTDVNPYPAGGCSAPATAVCLTDAQIQAELKRVIASGELPGATGPPVYYVLTPPGVTVCTEPSGGQCSVSNSSSPNPPNGMCGYHSVINPTGPNTVIYAVQPWVAGDAGKILVESPLLTAEPIPEVSPCQDDSGLLEEPNQLLGLNPFGAYEEGLADVIVNDLSIEQTDTVVDPLLNGWYQTSTHAEQADMCQWRFGPSPEPAPEAGKYTHAASLSDEEIAEAKYYLQENFSSAGVTSGAETTCWPSVTVEPYFTVPNPVNAGDVIALDASESLLTLAAKPKGLPANEPFSAPVYKWEFGDGNTVTGTEDASVFHTYTYGGLYEVKLTVTDSAGNVNTSKAKITVNGKLSPAGEKEKAEQEKAEKEKAEKEKAEKERPARERAEQEKAEQEKAAKEKSEREAAEKAAQEKAAQEKAAQEKAAQEKAAQEKAAQEKSAQEKSEREAAEKAAQEKAAKEKSEKEKSEKEKAEQEKGAKEATKETPTATSTQGTSGPALRTPAASARVLSRSLKVVLSKGLPVQYKVNERVSGRVELLLASSVAAQLGITGVPAAGLPAGAAPAIVIARAVLVTTSGGEGRMSVHLSKSARKHLKKLRSVALTLRLTVSAAAGATPTTVSHPFQLQA